MRITIQGKKDQPTPDPLIEKKIKTLSRYLSTIEDVVVEAAHDHHHRKGAVASIEITAHLLCHGNDPIRAHETADDIHAALDGALQKMKHLLTLHKEKETHVDRAAIRVARGKE